MKKLIAVLLLCATLLSCLASCSEDVSSGTEASDTTTGEAKVENIDIDLTGYTIIRSEHASAELAQKIVELKRGLENRTGLTFGYTDDFLGRNEVEAEDAKEIVVGITNRTVSKNAAAEIVGSGFTVRLSGQRIVILGTDDMKTQQAIDYFVENYLTKIQSSVLTVPENFCYNSELVPSYDLLKDSKSEFTVIYSESLDTSGSSSSDSDKVDAEFDWAWNLSKQLNKITGAVTVKLDTDWVKKGSEPDSEKFEIIVGDANRPELESVKADLGVDEYTVRVVGKKLIVFGWSLKTMKLAYEHLTAMINSDTVIDENGKANLSVSSDYNYTGKITGWVVDIPSYDGGVFAGAFDANFDTLCTLYENTNESEYTAYCEKLIANGYTLYFENNIAGNVFKTYTKDKYLLHTYYIPTQNRVKLVSGKSIDTLPKNIESETDFVKVCDMSMTQMILNYPTGTFGMCYIITLEDGSYMIYDGGAAPQGANDHVRLYNILRDNNKRPDKKIVIASWIITHPHGDHWAVFRDFVNNYSGSVTIENVVMNPPNMLELYNALGVTNSGDSAIPTVIARAGANFIIPHTGQYFYVRNLKVEVLYTHETAHPYNLDDFNNTSMVTRFSVGGQTVMMLGDIELVGSRLLVEMYGKELKCDIVQMAHHGSNGATLQVYQLMDPTVLLWPCSQSSFDYKTTKDYNQGEKNGYFTINYTLIHRMNVKENLVADGTNKTLPLPYTVGTYIEFK